MAVSRQVPKDGGWEKKYAPRVTRRHVAVAVTVYALWLAFLAIIAANRWLGSLQ
ncbi:MAG: hypothetical protein JXQ75_18000 [Phycisphaerae bacterium]|nr:hypothetical protein [Phycisphaerae bacterium]